MTTNEIPYAIRFRADNTYDCTPEQIDKFNAELAALLASEPDKTRWKEIADRFNDEIAWR
jgi:hypothetical protein